MKTTPLYQVDAFTAHPFAGSPAGVCLLDAPHPEQWMLAVAREMNLPETAFLLPEGESWNLRWFTPRAEIDLAGHATLAAAHILWTAGLHPEGKLIRFNTRAGLLTAARQKDGWIELDYPAQPAVEAEPLPGLVEALGVKPIWCGHYLLRYLLELATEEEVNKARPNFELLRAVEKRGVILTARATTPGYDFVSRFFATYLCIDEDPVTGSTHTILAPYWTARLNKSPLMGFQTSARGGALRLRMLPGEGTGRVGMAGQAVTIFRAELHA